MQENKLQERKYILPLSDFGFKRVFATEKDKCLLIDLLNLCVTDDFGIITDIAYLPNEQLGEREEEKKVVFDIYCRNQDDDRFIIEMQRAERPSFFRRLNTYVSRIISRKVQVGDGEYRIPRVASVNILDYEMSEFKDSERFFRLCEYENMNTMERTSYNKSILEYADVREAVDFAQVKGRVEGRVEGRAEGEAKAKLEMAKLLLEQGVDLEIIAKTTGFAAEEILGN